MPFGIDLALLLAVAGIVLIILEALAPGAHFMVLGVALLASGLLGMAFPTPLGTPLALSISVVVAGLVAFYLYREVDIYPGEAGRTSDSSSLVGTTGRVTDRVTGSEGQVKLDDGGFNPHFQARSVQGDIPEGEEVIVVDPGGGNVLTVESTSGVEYDGIDAELERDREQKEHEDAEETA